MFHKRLMKEFRENRTYVAGMVAAQWISLLANVMLILTAAWYLQRILYKTGNPYDGAWVLAILAGIVAVRSLMTKLNSRLSFLASAHVKQKLRELIFKKLMELGSGYRSAIPSSEAVQISTEGVDQLEIYFGKYVPQFFYSLIAPLTLFLFVSQMSLKAAVVLIVCVPLIPVSIVMVQKFAKRLLQKYWGSYTELGDSFLENLQGLTTLKIYQADEKYAEKMDEEAERFRKITMRVLIMQLNSISVMDLVAYGGAAAGILIGILEYAKGAVSFSQCFFILMISAEFFLPLRLLGSFFHIAMNGNAAADKIFRLLDAETPPKGSVMDIEDTTIRLEHITFSYEEGQEILRDVNAGIPKSSFTAIAGVSGCGKSTIASLLMGEHRRYEGRLLLGERDIRTIAEDSILRTITRIGHESYLFKGTVEENLRMGKQDASAEELYDALKKVKLYDTIQEKGGLSMELTEKAANLSGGQRQRLALARAILHDSEIYILDEATSNIDAESENQIMQAVRELAETKTVILISHRLANLKNADQILMMEKGRITEQGTFDALLEQNGAFAEMYRKQKRLERYAEEGGEGL